MVSRYLLIAAAICMGGIGIWCMHYIGNLAIELGDSKNGQIVYDSRCTAASFFLPIFVLLSAFYLLGVVEAAGYAYIITSGTLGGAAIVGMHYLGQLGIANYNCSYGKAFVVAAAIIAVVATNVALFVFFRMRANWSNDWWKRVLCAMVLAGAVSGMHWVATIGTYYHHRDSYSEHTIRLSRTQTVIICTSLVSDFEVVGRCRLNSCRVLDRASSSSHLPFLPTAQAKSRESELNNLFWHVPISTMLVVSWSQLMDSYRTQKSLTLMRKGATRMFLEEHIRLFSGYFVLLAIGARSKISFLE